MRESTTPSEQLDAFDSNPEWESNSRFKEVEAALVWMVQYDGAEPPKEVPESEYVLFGDFRNGVIRAMDRKKVTQRRDRRI